MWIKIFSGSILISFLSLLILIFIGLIKAINKKNSLKKIAFLDKIIKLCLCCFFLFVLTAAFSFFMIAKKNLIQVENVLQKRKSSDLIDAIKENEKSREIIIEWLPTRPILCMKDEWKHIDQSNCINMVFEVNSKIKPENGFAIISDIIKKIDFNKYGNLNGVYLSITPIQRKPNCEDAQITPYGVGRCFLEYEPKLIEIKGG